MKCRNLRETSEAMASLTMKLMELKREIQHERIVSVGEKLEKNSERVRAYVSDLKILAASRNDCTVSGSNGLGNLLSLRMSDPLFQLDRLIEGSADRDDTHSQEVTISAPIKFPHIERIPPYTTWIFLNKNQRMADDQSVIGRRRIYYDQHGSETLICSDSEDELRQLDLVKHEFSAGEDRVLRLSFQEYGLGDEVLDMLTGFVGGTRQEIQEHCNIIMDQYQLIDEQNFESSKEESLKDHAFLEKSLSDALDSFDNLFCRRCLIFDCRLHGFSQRVTCSNEKQPFTLDSEKDHKPCANQCYFRMDNSKDLPTSSAVDPVDECKASNQNSEQGYHLRSDGRSMILQLMNLSASKPFSGDPQSSSSEMHSTTPPNQVPEMYGSHGHELKRDAAKNELNDTSELRQKQACKSNEKLLKVSQGCSDWRPLEKDLYLKGLEIFGKNSCFISRNLLSGLKTCKEVSSYMYGDGAVKSRGSSALTRSFLEDLGGAEIEHLQPDTNTKSRICRKRGRVRKVKSSWKSAGHPSLWRRIADGKDLPCKHYSPCGCEPLCGKQCPCLQTGTCCEKYCGCTKSCKNRFRGCHCAKSQCKSRQCPCFAAGRECDPDVCRNCWTSCGGGHLGEPARRGDNQCGNMKLLLKQQQRILLARSDVAGWGAFLQNSVNKNDYLGEYTGELISHQEADKRGKIYDRANSSFLFDLNDKFVLDAYRKGDKLKFANHSATPNCHAKVMLVAGDHRVGIYANEHIDSGQELFYDYRYGPDQAPAWARKPETSKRDGSPIQQGRAKKHQSG